MTTDVDTESFAEFYRRTRPAMVRMAFLLTGGNLAAEDLVQDAYLRVYARWSTVENPVAYLRVAVVNGATSYRRRRAMERSRGSTSAPAEAAVQPVDELRDSLRRLPARQRAAIVLRYYVDLPEAEIAATLGCGVPAVKSLLFRALATLREVVDR